MECETLREAINADLVSRYYPLGCVISTEWFTFQDTIVATFVLMENIMLYNDAVLLTMLYIESSIIIFFMVTTE